MSTVLRLEHLLKFAGVLLHKIRTVVIRRRSVLEQGTPHDPEPYSASRVSACWREMALVI